MKLPKVLKIGGHTITVTLADLGGDTDGDFSTEKNEIRIHNKLPPSQMGATLLHEIMHALNAQFHKDMEHIILESLSQQLYQVLKDNKLQF